MREVRVPDVDGEQHGGIIRARAPAHIRRPLRRPGAITVIPTSAFAGTGAPPALVASAPMRSPSSSLRTAGALVIHPLVAVAAFLAEAV